MKRPPSAVWLVHKPAGVSSASLVDDFRRSHAGNFTLKVSHGGVLDPFAQGLVLLLVGAANRLFEALHEVPKTYVARVRWGVETDTGDGGGREVMAGDASQLTAEQLDAVLERSRGWLDQVPPATSNKRVEGERAYVRAQRGETFELPAQRVFLSSSRWVGERLGRPPTPLPGREGLTWSMLELSVRGGFYVRSFVRDLGRALGCGAHVETLERTAIGPWVDPREPAMLTGREVLPWLPSLELDDAAWGALKQGTRPRGQPTMPTWPLPSGFPPPSAGVRAFHQGRLVALLRDDAVLMLPGGV